MGDQSPSLEAPPMNQREGSKKDIRRGAMKQGRSAGVIEEKQVRRNGAIKYFLLTGSEVRFEL